MVKRNKPMVKDHNFIMTDEDRLWINCPNSCVDDEPPGLKIEFCPRCSPEITMELIEGRCPLCNYKSVIKHG